MKNIIKLLLYPITLLVIILILANSNKITDKGSQTNAVKDVDGNFYDTIRIGTQVWMKQNLKVTHYRNGDPIPNIKDGSDWNKLSTAAYCDYDNKPTTYGKLYNWYAVNDSRNIAPTGWHVPTDADWTVLTDYFKGESVAGGKLKESGFRNWAYPNSGATKEDGFTALPGGYRKSNGTFGGIVYSGSWWTSTESDTVVALYRGMFSNYSSVLKSYQNKNSGFSVRCVKDK